MFPNFLRGKQGVPRAPVESRPTFAALAALRSERIRLECQLRRQLLIGEVPKTARGDAWPTR
jgi:hypothetical protein